MPYSGIDDPSLPKDVQESSPAQRKRFIAAFNAAYTDCDSGDCEGQAFRIARSAMNEKTLEQELESYLKTLDDIEEDIKAKPSCERCGTFLDAKAMDLAGILLCDDCNTALTKAVIKANDATLRKHYGGKGILERLFGVKTKSDTGFKVLAGNKWVAWYTNARMDLENEKFSYSGLQRDVKRQNESGDYPELWFYHVAGTRHGKATNSFVVKDMVVAVGEFDDNPIADAMKLYYEKTVDVALSHGFVYDSSKFDGTTYEEFKTFEISTLPRGKEANPFTSFGLLEMKAMDVTVSEDQKQGLEEALGSDLAQQVIGKAPESFEKATKALEGIVGYKAPMMDDDEEENEDGKKPPMKKSDDSTPSPESAKAGDIAQAVIAALAPQFEAQSKMITQLAEANKGLHERLVQVEGAPKKKEMPHNPDIMSLLQDEKQNGDKSTDNMNPTQVAVHKLFGGAKS